VGGSFFILDAERRISRVVKQEDGRVFQFDFADFEGPDLLSDLRRRDFAINAMALELREFLTTNSLAAVIDPCGGRADIDGRTIRTTRHSVLDDDPLRLLRAARFAATLGYAIDPETAAAVRARAGLIARPAPERVRDELFLIFAERNAEAHLRLLDSLGLFSRLFPELEPLRNFAPGLYHVHDVLTHSMKTAGYLDSVLDDLPRIAAGHGPAVLEHLEELLEQNVPRKAALRFACLLHDNAKPETYTHADGKIRFHNHDSLGADKASLVCRRFRLSKETEKAVTKAVRQHMRLFNLSSAPGGPTKNAMHRYCRDLGDALPESLLLAQADARATAEIMPKEKFADTEQPMAQVLDYYYAKFRKVETSPLVTGDDLIAKGFPPGPRFREILDELKEKQAEGALRDRGEALDYLERFK
jgi:tRNA nucleotidyltransferase/poly(A) polymerase